MPTERFPPSAEASDPPEGGDGVPLLERIALELELLARNVDILEKLAGRPPIGIIRLSEALKLPIHKVRYSLHLLEREGVIQPSADGAVVTDQLKEYWKGLDGSLERMATVIQQLKERTRSHNNAAPPGRKGY